LFATQDAHFADVAVWLTLAEFSVSVCVQVREISDVSTEFDASLDAADKCPVCLRIANYQGKLLCTLVNTLWVLASQLASSDAGLGLICGSTLLGGVWLGAALCSHDRAPFL